jgi:hypothetical protein
MIGVTARRRAAAVGLCIAVFAGCGGGSGELEPLSGGAPTRPSSGETVADPADAFDRPSLQIQVPHLEPRLATLVDPGAAPHQELRLRPASGTVQRIRMRRLHTELTTFQGTDGIPQSNSVSVGPYHHLADTVVVEAGADRFSYDRWLVDYDISDTGRGFENRDLRNEFAATKRTDGIRLVVTDRADVLGFAVLNVVTPDDQPLAQRTLLGDSVLLAALPAEPIGVGATWTIHAVGPSAGYLFDHNATLTLLELHPDRAVVQLEQHSTPRPQAEQTTWINDLQEYTLRAYGTITYRFDLPVPLIDIKIDGVQHAEGARGSRTERTFDHTIVELAD